MKVHSDRKAQITTLIADKASVTVPAKYSDFEDSFSIKSAVVLLEYTKINTHVINQEESEQLFYGPIYSLRSLELETMKTYIKTNLANGFIHSSKCPAGTPILFGKKLNGSFWLYVNYWGLSNITIKNRYLFPFISESLNCLNHAKQFT